MLARATARLREMMATAARRLLVRRGPTAPALRRLGTAPPPPPAGATLRLFGYAICPFCHAVRSAARYTKTPLALTEVNPLTKAEIKFSETHKKVPIAVLTTGRSSSSPRRLWTNSSGGRHLGRFLIKIRAQVGGLGDS